MKKRAASFAEALALARRLYGNVSPCYMRTWETSVEDGFLWFNDENHSTHIIKISSDEVNTELVAEN